MVVDISEFPAGMYLVRILTSEAQVIRKVTLLKDQP
jgi:hypothetical protein